MRTTTDGFRWIGWTLIFEWCLRWPTDQPAKGPDLWQAAVGARQQRSSARRYRIAVSVRSTPTRLCGRRERSERSFVLLDVQRECLQWRWLRIPTVKSYRARHRGRVIAAAD